MNIIMKYLILIFSVFFIFSACKKDETGFDKTDLLGNWQEINIDKTDLCTNYINFSDDTYSYYSYCGTSNSSSTNNYTFDGKKINTPYETWEIVFLNSVTLKIRVDESVYISIREFKKP